MAAYPAGPHIADRSITHLQTLQLAGSEKLTQSIAWDPASGECFLAKAVGRDTHILRYDTAWQDHRGRHMADLVSTMIWKDGGHGSTIFCLRQGTSLKVGGPWDTRSSAGNITRRDVAMIPYRAGAHTKTQAQVLHVFTDHYCVAALDLDNDLAVLRVLHGGVEWFEVRRWSDILANRDRQLNKLNLRRRVPGTFQGVTISGRSIYAVYGETSGKADWAAGTPDPVHVYEWDWPTGRLLTKADHTAAWQLPGDPLQMSEPESINILRLDGQLVVVLAFKCGSGDDGDPDEREVRLTAITPVPAPPSPVTESETAVAKYRSQNGFTAARTTAGIPGGVQKIHVDGVPNATFVVRAGDVAVIFGYLINQLHRRVEPVNVDKIRDDWSYYFRAVRGTIGVIRRNLSNHSSATAIDYNAVRHPLGVRWSKNFSAADYSTIIRITDTELERVIDWGGLWRRPDAMHFEIAPGTSVKDLKRVADKIRAGYTHKPRPPAPPKPTTPGHKVKIDLSAIQKAFKAAADAGEQGMLVQRALNRVMGAKLTVDGELGRNSRTVMAQLQARIGKLPTSKAWPNRGSHPDCDGIPGRESLTRLGFDVQP